MFISRKILEFFGIFDGYWELMIDVKSKTAYLSSEEVYCFFGLLNNKVNCLKVEKTLSLMNICCKIEKDKKIHTSIKLYYIINYIIDSLYIYIIYMHKYKCLSTYMQ